MTESTLFGNTVTYVIDNEVFFFKVDNNKKVIAIGVPSPADPRYIERMIGQAELLVGKREIKVFIENSLIFVGKAPEESKW